ncbi:membrane protein insertion efficiency factor YidD [Gloeothece verrucosa]|uniref:Membrane protein insertion efficiency factor YidD n=1 Tax=Gloeothece verrucosa (strain PCC 7822) TaxID=497965 RepID=E0UJF7_GLOV7|nr:membrane protein insertion efficiency factor YidD [Gloeothece verrucosa]ADN16975.1 conserved hypothetical protein [Gloeothece verrucosa PCC 7822]
MNTISLESLARNGAVWSINGYQKHISPKKGFSCPHRLLHGGLSCSEYVKSVFMDQNLSQVVKMSVERFKDCALASKHLQTQSSGGCLIVPCCIPI